MRIHRTSARRTVSEWLSQAFLASRRVTDVAARERATGLRSIPILNFHRVSDYRTDHWMTIAPDAFADLVRALKRRYRLITLAEMDDVLAAGRNTEELLAVTFDDSYGCNYRCAVPVLKALQVPATFFVVSDVIDRGVCLPHDIARGFEDLPNFSSDEIRAIARDSLFEIGSHTVSHADFSAMQQARTIERELCDSKARLSSLARTPVTRLAIPFGTVAHCTPEVVAAARRCGYRRLYSHFGGRNAVVSGGHVGYVLNRICEVGSPRFLTAMLEGYQGWRSIGRTPIVTTSDSAFHPALMSRRPS